MKAPTQDKTIEELEAKILVENIDSLILARLQWANDIGTEQEVVSEAKVNEIKEELNKLLTRPKILNE